MTEQTTPQADRRVLLKLSGEAFGGGKVGLSPDVVRGIAEQIAECGYTNVRYVDGGYRALRSSSVG